MQDRRACLSINLHGIEAALRVAFQFDVNRFKNLVRESVGSVDPYRVVARIPGLEGDLFER